jgi:hypothetical protein
MWYQPLLESATLPVVLSQCGVADSQMKAEQAMPQLGGMIIYR